MHTPSLEDEAIDRVDRWLRAAIDSTTGREQRAFAPLRRLIEDPQGVPFAMRFIDRVVRPDEPEIAAQQLRALVADAPLPRFLPATDRALLRLGAWLSRWLPGLVMPLARRRMRGQVGDLVLDADPERLARHLARAREAGYAQNVNLLGEAVLGEREAARRLEATLALIDRPEVDYVSIKLSSVASQLDYWDWSGSLERVVERLERLFDRARSSRPRTFVNLDMEEYHDLELTLQAFMRVLDEDRFLDFEAGIVLQAYLPDAFEALERLLAWAKARSARGGGPIRIRLVKGANLAMERVEAALHGWEQAPFATKHEVDASYKRCLDRALRPECLEGVRIGVASHNLFDVAFALGLARARGVTEHVGFEMLQGMAPALAREVRAESGNMLLYTPVVGAEDFDVAVGYLFRRLDENASPGNFLRSLFNLQPGSAVFETEAERFRRSAADRDVVSSTPRRRQARPAAAARARSGPDTAFDNEPDTDPALASNRAWAARVLAEPPSPPRTPVETRRQAVDEALDRVRRAQADWSRRSAAERRDVLYAVADELARRRGELVSAMVHEANKTFAQADPEVSEAIDFARYYGLAATGLEDPTLLAEDVRFEPFGVVGVVPPWNFPVAIPAGGVLAALAAGNGVVVKPAPETPRCAELVVECCHAAGVPRDLLVCLRVPEDETGRHLVTSVDALILTGSIDTAQLFQSWRPDLRLFAETSGKNALVVTPHADLDLAVRDLVQSAFGHSGQKCSAASLAICVGPVYASPRFRRQLVDAVESLSIGSTREPGTSMGPTIGPASERLRRGLTQLDAGERWLVEPRCLGPRDGGELWTPGVRLGVAPDSWLHRTECFGPVLGLIPARDLDHAIRIQNAGAFGLTGGLHSLDPEEIETWIERVEVGNAYVNRPITGAIVRRQPFGGWKRSAVGPGAKAGGPNYVRQLGTWRPTRALDPARAEASDRRWWQTHFGVAHDPTGLAAESNVFRYRPIAGMLIRALPDADEGALERVRSAARTCGVEVVESRAGAESDEALAARLTTLDVARIRVVGPATDGRAVVSPVLRRAAVLAGIHVADEPVTASGRIELLHGLREQAVSRTLHRFGNPSLFAGARGAAAAPAGGAGRGG